jgi:tRNA (mo5U34)-methyltransferase
MELMANIRAKDDACAQWQTRLRDEFGAKGFYHSIELPDGRVLEGILKIDTLKERLKAMSIPPDLAGKRALDIGTWDGYFAFQMEKRGAEVMAIDKTESPNFRGVRELLASSVDYRVMDVYELSPETVGRFDIVLFLGVLYHLKHPLLALEAVCSVTRSMAVVESFVTNEALRDQNGKSDLPAMEFYETDELLGEVDNWVGPNVQCLLAFCRTAGFARTVLLSVKEQRAIVACYRQWEPEPAEPSEEAPQLSAAVHTVNYGVNFSAGGDEYVAAFFKTSAPNLTIDTVMPQVGSYGVRPVAVVHDIGPGWQVNFRLPPGLEPGWQEVRVRTANSRYSNAVRVAVDMPARAEQLAITNACDANTWELFTLERGNPAALSVWVAGLPENADRHNVRLRLGKAELRIEHVAPPEGNKPRQINAELKRSPEPGEHELLVSLGHTVSAPVKIRAK